MRFEEVLPALREGKKIRLKGCKEFEYLFKPKNENELRTEDYHTIQLSWEDFFRDDWEIIKEKTKVKLRDLTDEQFKKYCESITQSPDYGKKCSKCLFRFANCAYMYENCWIKHKDLYSDKFLDQEIEIEEESK